MVINFLYSVVFYLWPVTAYVLHPVEEIQEQLYVSNIKVVYYYCNYFREQSLLL